MLLGAINTAYNVCYPALIESIQHGCVLMNGMAEMMLRAG